MIPSRIDTASILLDLTHYDAIIVTWESFERQVLAEPIEPEATCPSCGVLTTLIQARPVHQVRGLTADGDGLQFLFHKRH